MPPQDKYTNPELRDQLKEETHNSDKGGAPGQWSARKARMMASEYKKRGGGYTTDKKDKEQDQKYLDQWTEEEWQTKGGSGNAKKEYGTEKRYLPKKAWEQNSEKEKQQTDDKKQVESKQGNQYVSNTSKAKNTRKYASKDENDSGSDKGNAQNGQKKNIKNAKDCTQHWEDSVEKDQQNYRKFKKDDQGSKDASEEEEEQSDQSRFSGGEDQGQKEELNTKKRGHGANQRVSNKKQKQTNGASKDGPKGSAGDKTRVPKRGQRVQWKALPGYVNGVVEQILFEQKGVDGKTVKASKQDPRIVLRSDSSGKICVHKPEAVYFD